jgi:hypothetical protein
MASFIRIEKPVVDNCESKEKGPGHELTHAYGTYESTAELLNVWGKLFSGQPTMPSSPAGWAVGKVSGCAANNTFWCFNKIIPGTSGGCQRQYLAVMAKFQGVAGYPYDVRRFKGFYSSSECSSGPVRQAMLEPALSIALVEYEVFPRKFPKPNEAEEEANKDADKFFGGKRIFVKFDDSQSALSAPIWGGQLKAVKRSIVVLLVRRQESPEENAKGEAVAGAQKKLVQVDTNRPKEYETKSQQNPEDCGGKPGKGSGIVAQLVVQRPWGRKPNLIRREIWFTDDWNPNPAGTNILDHQPAGGCQPLPRVVIAYPQS